MTTDYIQSWDLWCGHYDPLDKEIEIIKSLIPLEGKKLLEVGCGDGRLAFKLASHCERVVGIDFDKRLIESAESKKRKCDVKNVSFHTQDACRMDLEADFFDIALYPWILHWLDEPAIALRECHRVLKKGGKIILIGLLPGSDFENVLQKFSESPNANLNPKTKYEQPLISVFGEIEQTRDEVFPFVFPSEGIAYQALAAKLIHVSAVNLSTSQHEEIRNYVRQRSNGTEVHLTVPATIYQAKKL